MNWKSPKFAVLGLALAVLVAFGLMWKSRRDARQDFEAYRRQLLASGAKLTMAAAAPPPNTNAASWRAELERLAGSSVTRLISVGSLVQCLVGDSTNGYRSGWTVDRPPAEKGEVSTWEALVDDMTAANNDLAALVRQLANPPPRSDVDYRLGSTNAIRFVLLRAAVQAMKGALVHSLHEGNHGEALRSLRAMAGLVALFKDDGPLVGLMIRTAILSLVNDCVAASLLDPKWNNGELAELSRIADLIEVMSSTRQAFEMERAQLAEMIDWELGGRDAEVRALVGSGPGLGWLARMEHRIRDAFDVVPSGPAQAKKALMVQSSVIELLFDNAGRPVPAKLKAALKVQTDALDGPHSKREVGLYQAAFARIEKALQSVFLQEAIRRLKLAAIAIEQHKRRHGRLPLTLEELVPAFLKTVPLDPMDGMPLRYRLHLDGGFRLYSIGTDLKDDGGVGSLRQEDKDLVFPWPAKK